MKQFFLFLLFICVIATGAFATGSQEEVEQSTVEAAWTVEDPSFNEWGQLVKSAYEGQTVSIAMANHPVIHAFRKMIDDFENLTGVEVVIDEIEERSLRDKILVEHVGKTGRYDIVMTDVVWVGEFAEKGVITKIDNYLSNSSLTPSWYDYEDFIPTYRDGLGKYDNSVYGIPLGGEVTTMAVRTDILKEQGIHPDSIDDLYELRDVFAQLKDNGVKEYPFTFRARKGHNIIYTWLQFLYPFGGRIFEDGGWEPALDSEETIESIRYLVSLKEFAPPGVESFTPEENNSLYRNGRAVFWMASNVPMPVFSDPERSPKIAGKIDMFATPAGPAGELPGWAGWNLALSSSAPNPSAAWALLAYITSRHNAEKFVSYQGTVSRTSILENPEYQQQYWWFEPTADALDNAHKLVEMGIDWRPRIPEWPQIQEEIGFWLSEALIERITPEEAGIGANEAVWAIMEDAGYYDD